MLGGSSNIIPYNIPVLQTKIYIHFNRPNNVKTNNNLSTRKYNSLMFKQIRNYCVYVYHHFQHQNKNVNTYSFIVSDLGWNLLILSMRRVKVSIDGMVGWLIPIKDKKLIFFKCFVTKISFRDIKETHIRFERFSVVRDPTLDFQ